MHVYACVCVHVEGRGVFVAKLVAVPNDSHHTSHRAIVLFHTVCHQQMGFFGFAAAVGKEICSEKELGFQAAASIAGRPPLMSGFATFYTPFSLLKGTTVVATKTNDREFSLLTISRIFV